MNQVSKIIIIIIIIIIRDKREVGMESVEGGERERLRGIYFFYFSSFLSHIYENRIAGFRRD